MAINLFTKTHLAQQASTSASAGGAPSFVICEQEDSRAEKFMSDLRNKGGSELSQRVQRAGTGKEYGLPGLFNALGLADLACRVAGSASRIMTMLPSTPQVEAVYLDPSTGILAGLPQDEPPLPHELASGAETTGTPQMPASETSSFSQPPTPSSASTAVPPTIDTGAARRPHTVLIDGTTLDPTAAKRVAEQVHTRTGGGAVMLDAPVSGGIVAAEAGTLTIMFGSPSPIATALAVPMLQRMAREGGVIPCGANGTGVGVKVCNK